MNANTFPDEWHHSKRVSLGDVRRGLDGASLPKRKAILDFVRSNAGRIHPAMDDDWFYAARSLYLLACIARKSEAEADDASVHTPFEAAHELVHWFNWIVARDDNQWAMQIRIEHIAAAYKNGCSSVRNCIETGFLEHVLEFPKNRRFFAHWNNDEDLAESFTEALRWGEAHTNPNAP